MNMVMEIQVLAKNLSLGKVVTLISLMKPLRQQLEMNITLGCYRKGNNLLWKLRERVTLREL